MSVKQLLELDEEALFEGNRSFQATPERIEDRKRTADGTLRVDEIAVKHKFSISWTHLPAADELGGKGRGWLRALYLAGGEYTLRVYKEGLAPDYDDYTVRFAAGGYQESIVFRNAARWVYAVSIQLEEV
ncbi:MAG: hypothetical protein SWK76_16985 [Actinomycetota bacterium]|nr:hypothetical protein [Actinomycetota bacterium]